MNIHIYSLIFSFTISVCLFQLLYNDFYVCFILFDDVHALLATSTHFKWELMLYCLHCPTLNKVFLLLLLLVRDKPIGTPAFFKPIYYVECTVYLGLEKLVYIQPHSW